MTRYRTNAAFQSRGKWQWVVWEHYEPNKHAAILDKAHELGSDRWDYGNSDHAECARYNRHTRP